MKTEAYKRTLADIGPILFRHVFLLVNGVIFAVVIFLFIFGNPEAAIFLGAMTVFNICLGVIQDTRARLALETLQLLTALRVIRIRAGTEGAAGSADSEEEILAEEVKKGDLIRLRLGDQVPCDGLLISSKSLEVSEALITGEADSFARSKGEKVNAGDVVTAGTAVLEAQNDFGESQLAKMTEEAKRYSASPSPIQQAINDTIRYTGYILFAVIAFAVIRGLMVHDPSLRIVMNIGALASTIIPQGLVVITTLLFAFGASSYSKKHVLFQEINATEKLGRIKNLCLDKTGTLTENHQQVQEMHVYGAIPVKRAQELAWLYAHNSGDSSQTLVAVGKYLDEKMGDKNGMKIGADKAAFDGLKVSAALPFSSWRKFGVVTVENAGAPENILVGAPDVFLPYISDPSSQNWLKELIEKNSHQGKRLLCMVRAEIGNDLAKIDLSKTKLSPVAVFIFQGSLREGIKNAIAFFQERKVRIRIISGDNADTVRAIAQLAGVNNSEAVITGSELEKWSDQDYASKTRNYTIFARINPRQKVKIIEALKHDGFTAMVGDGANDALAIKKADLGIAMFDGVPATRRLAGVILMKNSFSDLPGGVELADNFIRNIEIFAGIFINQSVLGLLFFIMISAFGYAYPLTPLNITLINYFAVGIPGMLIGYWAIRPTGKILPASTHSFLSLVLPFVMWSALIEAIALTVVFLVSPEYLRLAWSNTLVALGFVVCGFIFFIFAPKVYRGFQTRQEKWHLFWLAIIEIVLLGVILKIPILVRFFNVTTPLPSLAATAQAVVILVFFGIGLYLVKNIQTKSALKAKALQDVIQ